MRLFMTTDAVGGVWTYAVDLARGLAARGVATSLAVIGPSPSTIQREQAVSVSGLELIETGLPLDWQAERVAEIAVSADKLSAMVESLKPDIVHLNSPSLAALAPFGANVVGACHSCVATWWQATHTGDLPENLVWQRDLLARGYARCDRLVAPSAAFARATARLYGHLPAVVHNGRDAPPALETSRERCVLTAGRLWDCAKNLAALDAVAALIDAPVYAAGALQMPPGAAIQVSHVVPLGPLANADLRARMARTAVFASLAVYEPFGLSVLEAAQCGCALVLSDIATFRELWEGAAIFVAPSDRLACARALSRLLDSPSEARSWGEASRARASSYALARMTQGMLDLYHGLQTRGGAAA